MSGQTLHIDVPEEVVQLFDSPAAAQTRAKEALIMSLLREGRIGQSRAAELLGVTRWDVLDLMARHDVASGPLTAGEVDAELDDAEANAEAKPFWKAIVEEADSVPDDVASMLPTDLAENLDHYLYGAPKKG